MRSLRSLHRAPRRLAWAVACGALTAGCAKSGADPAGPDLSIAVRPLDLPGVHYACYDILVTGPDGQPVWSAGDPSVAYTEGDQGTLCTWQYGGGLPGGALSYVGPCVADDGDGDQPAVASNTVTLWVDGLYQDPDGDHDPDEDQPIPDWQDPCPNGCQIAVSCQENADTPVEFDFDILRQANQGFFDVGVEFSDLFCSAKLDCVSDFLSDPATGQRGPTAILAFACTSGQNPDGSPQDTHLLLDDIKVVCDGPPAHTYTIDPSQGPGMIGGQPEGLFQIATYRDQEDLLGLDKCFWNTAIGLDLETVADPGVLESGCTLVARGTAADHALAHGDTPAGAVYPVITWNVPLTDSSGALICGENPVNGVQSGVQTVYTQDERFTCALDCDTGEIDCPGRTVCAGNVPSIPDPVTLTQTHDGAVSLSFEGHAYDFQIPDGYSVAACCPDNCCQAPTAIPGGPTP